MLACLFAGARWPNRRMGGMRFLCSAPVPARPRAKVSRGVVRALVLICTVSQSTLMSCIITRRIDFTCADLPCSAHTDKLVTDAHTSRE